MLNAANVKQHGMRDKRWTVQDKISQYKALVHLYTRDKEIMLLDKLKDKQCQPKYVEYLSKEAISLRAKKDEALTGDMQALRNAFLPDRRKKLAYQNLPPHEIIEHFDKDIFDDRKALDRLRYRITQKRDKLIQLKLQASVLEDRLKYEIGGNVPTEIKIKEVTAGVQDAILKKVAAISVRNIYKEIIHVMKKDSIYFDAILNTLFSDTNKKKHYLMRTIQLGQLATESKDDRRAECNELELELKRQITIRLEEIKCKKETSATITKKVCVKPDSTMFCEATILCARRSFSDTRLEKDLSAVREFITKLKDTSMCVDSSKIIPCFIDQQEQFKRMQAVKDYIHMGKDTMMNRLNHAHLVEELVETHMGDETEAFEDEERELLRQIKLQEDRKVAIRLESRLINETVAKVELYLKSLASSLHIVNLPVKKGKGLIYSTEQSLLTFDTVFKKINVLIGTNAPPLDEHAKEIATDLYAKFMDYPAVDLSTVETESATRLVAELKFEDPAVPTREAIKLLSKELTISGKEQQQIQEDRRLLAAIIK